MLPLKMPKRSAHFPYFLFLFLAVSVYGNSPEKQTITGLTWKAGPLRILREMSVGTFQVLIAGYYDQPGWKLYLADYLIPLEKDGEFSLLIPIEINRFKANFTAKGPDGEIERETVRVSLNEFFWPKKRGWVERQLRDLSLNIGVGTTFISYEQTELASIAETNLTPKLTLAYAIVPSEWILEGSGHISAVSFSKSALTNGGLKFFGADLHIGYQIPFDEGSGALFLFEGFYYTTTFGSDKIGYQRIAGPEFFPVLRLNFENGVSASFFAKYSPVLNGFSLLSFDNASFSAGISYYLKPFSTGILKGVPLGFTLEGSRLKLGIDGGQLVTTSYTLSANLMF